MKRFYQTATIIPEGPHWRVALDNKPIRTPGGRAQTVPTRALAEALAQEWASQPPEIDPTKFPLRDLTDFAIDAVAPDPQASIAAILAYAETDTLCYRADPDEPLHPRQRALWEPILTAAEARHGVRFIRVSGIRHRPQPAETLATLAHILAAQDPFTLTATRTLASLAHSLVIALAALGADADLPALWAAASLEEEWQANLWGREPGAEARRAQRSADFHTAACFARLASGV